MQIESIVHSVESDKVTEKSVSVDPIGEALEKKWQRQDDKLAYLIEATREYDLFNEKSVKADPIGDAIKKVI